MAVPNNIIVPFMGVEFNDSRAQAGSGPIPMSILLIAQKTASGTATAEVPYLVSSADEVAAQGGFGSRAHRFARKLFQNNRSVPVTAIYLDDAVGSAAATTVLTIAGTATAPGELDVYIDGDRYAVGVETGDTAEAVATDLVALITAEPNAPVTAGNVAGVVTFTAKNKGVAAGDIDIRLNYNRGESVPAGLTGSVAATTPGTTDPDIQDAIDALGDSWHPVWVGEYSDATNIGKIKAYLDAQNGPLVQKLSLYYTAKKGTRSEFITAVSNLTNFNSKHVSVGFATGKPTTNGELAAAQAAQEANSFLEDTALPVHRITLVGILPAEEKDRYTLLERNQVAAAGGSTFTDAAGVQTEATVTTYLQNDAGASSIAWQQHNTVFQLLEARYSFVQRILLKFSRAKLADNADRIKSSTPVLTRSVAIAEAVSWFRELEEKGVLENADQFIEEVDFKRSTTNPNRGEWYLPPDLVNQFIVGSGEMAFSLQG